MSRAIERPVAEYAALLPYPAEHANKYTRGSLLVVGGSLAYPGAAILAAQAAARSGAGYTRLACPASMVAAARAHLLSIPVSPCPDADGTFAAASLETVLAAGSKADALLVGSGMTVTPSTRAFLRNLLAHEKRPLVLDADALNIVAAKPDVLLCRKGTAPLVLTPHEGEAARLLGHVVKDREECALELARKYRATVALKGPDTLVATPGGVLVICHNAGPELAKAGTGDVLAGMLAAFVAQGLATLDAVTLGVYLHGEAGRVAAAALTSIAVMPEDVLGSIGSAMRELGVRQDHAGR